MNAVRGAVAVLLFFVSFSISPDDAAFRAMPHLTKFAVLMGVGVFVWGGIGMFIWGVVASEPWKQDKAVGDPSVDPTDKPST